jgi:hypothetical protein
MRWVRHVARRGEEEREYVVGGKARPKEAYVVGKPRGKEPNRKTKT